MENSLSIDREHPFYDAYVPVKIEQSTKCLDNDVDGLTLRIFTRI